MQQEPNEQLLVNAIKFGDLESARALVVICNINQKVNGKPVIHYAAMSSIEMLTLILNQPGIIIDAVDDSYGASALMIAAQIGCIDNVRILLKQGVNVTRNTKRNGKGSVALGFAIARSQLHDNADSESIAIIKLLLAHGAAFCLDEPRLKKLAPFMDHYSGCYFFDTMMYNEKITSKTKGFELATVFEFGDPDVKITYSEFPISILLSRCDEILSEYPYLRRLRELQRCLLFNATEEKENEAGQIYRAYVLGLQELCLEQIVRQPNIRLEAMPVDLHDSVKKFKELELCNKRIAELTELIRRSDIRRVLRVGVPLGAGFFIFMAAIGIGSFGLVSFRQNKLLLLMAIGLVVIAALLGLASTYLVNKINFHEFTKLNAFLQQVANEDAEERGLNVVIEVEGTTESIEYFEQYRSKLYEYHQKLSSHLMESTKHHHFFQGVCEDVNQELTYSPTRNLLA